MKQNKQRLQEVIEDWVNNEQNGDNPLDMWITDTLISRMTDAAWAVLEESQLTQQWLVREGHMDKAEL